LNKIKSKEQISNNLMQIGAIDVHLN